MDRPRKLVSFRFPEHEMAQWRESASGEGISLTEWLRRRANGGTVGPPVVAQEPTPVAQEQPLCAVPDCQVRAAPNGFCFAHRDLESSPFLRLV